MKNTEQTPAGVEHEMKLAIDCLTAGNTPRALAHAAAGLQNEKYRALALHIKAKSLVHDRSYAEAVEAFDELAETCYRQRPKPAAEFKVPAHFALFNAEQLAYLVERGIVPPPAPLFARDNAALIRYLRELVKTHSDDPPWITVSGADATLLSDLPFTRVREPAPFAALSDKTDLAAIDQRLKDADPQVAFVDDFLTPATLEQAQAFCLGSTVWRQPYKFGYVGAFPEHGFANALIFRIVAEFERAFPKTLAGAKLTQWWGFAYDSVLPGTGVHADDADVTLNLWITPDEANLDSGSGGLQVWDRSTPPEWSFDEYNSSGQKIREYLEESRASAQSIKYRCNRAVIFDGHLFHQTAPTAFAPGFENRRINLTFLFNRRNGG